MNAIEIGVCVVIGVAVIGTVLGAYSEAKRKAASSSAAETSPTAAQVDTPDSEDGPWAPYQPMRPDQFSHDAMPSHQWGQDGKHF